MLKDATVLGASIFQAGDNTPPLSTLDSSATWGSFCVSDDLVQMIGVGMTTPVPAPPAPIDPDLAYFGQYGHTPNAESALYKYVLLPLRRLYRELLAAGRTNDANEVNPGPCVGEPYTVVEDGHTKYRVKLSNRIIEVQCINGVWTPFQAELFLGK
jgi:hypothetical protein